MCAFKHIGINSKNIIAALFRLLEDENILVRDASVSALAKLVKEPKVFLTTLIEWLDVNQDKEHLVNGIDLLWCLTNIEE